MEIDDGTFRRIDQDESGRDREDNKPATGPTTSPGSRTTSDTFWLIVCATTREAHRPQDQQRNHQQITDALDDARSTSL
jgi:hypothetical protein